MKFKNSFEKSKRYIYAHLIPALVFGLIIGVATAVLVCLFKVCAKYAVIASENAYGYIREHLYLVPVAIGVLFALGLLFAYIYKRMPNAKGGGIPTSLGIIRGIITFKWLSNLMAVFFLSLTSFLLGVPLGTEGPSVQMGTAIGSGSVEASPKKYRAWSKYAMTGGSCAGFSVATGAPVSGILFAVEEIHQRMSPTIIVVASSSVLFANITSGLICPLLGVSERLFEFISLANLGISQYWIPLLVGVMVGLFSVLFLQYYRVLDKFHDNVLCKIPHSIKIFVIFALTLLFGLFSFSFVSTGHELILELMESKGEIMLLLLILVVRTTLSLGANASGITGGMFIPILAIGALCSSIIAKLLVIMGLGTENYTVVVVLGIAGCIAGGMKMPLTAIVFSVEALSCYNNIVPVIITSFVAYVIPEICNVKSINDTVIELREDYEESGKEHFLVDTYVTVKDGAFAIGRQIRDIIWPRHLNVLSVRHAQTGEKANMRSGSLILVGDVLHIRYTTADKEATAKELLAIVGEQKIIEREGVL